MVSYTSSQYLVFYANLANWHADSKTDCLCQTMRPIRHERKFPNIQNTSGQAVGQTGLFLN